MRYKILLCNKMRFLDSLCMSQSNLGIHFSPGVYMYIGIKHGFTRINVRQEMR